MELKNIKNKLDKLDTSYRQERWKLEDEAKNAFFELMSSKIKEVQKMTALLEASQELTTVVNDEYFHRWVRVDLGKLIDTANEFEKQLLSDYFQDQMYTTVDFDNEVITTAEGPCIVINDSGDVLDQDSGKWIISKSDYEDESERNKLIEEHMEKTGHFPSVVSDDNHGNCFYVNTKE